MVAPLRIDFVSDVTCPWCAIGLQALEQAIAALRDTRPIELHLQPFELNPGIACDTTPRGGFVVFPTHHRPQQGARGYYKVGLRHGVSTIASGSRTALGIIFHDAR